MPSADPRTMTAFRDLHTAACVALGIQPGHGSNGRVAAALGVTAQHYSGALSGRTGSLDLLAKWAGELGLEVRIPPEGAIVVRPTDVTDLPSEPTPPSSSETLARVASPCDGGGRGNCGSLLRLVVGHGVAVPGWIDLRCVRCGASSVIRPDDLTGAG